MECREYINDRKMMSGQPMQEICVLAANFNLGQL